MLSAEMIERLVEASLLLAVTWPVWRLLSFRPYRQRAPTEAATMASLLASYSVLVIVVAVFAPALLRTFVILGLFSGLALIWWVHSGLPYGGRLPPGRLTILPLAPCRDHRFYQRQVARYGPIFKTGSTLPCLSLRPTVCVVGHEQGLNLLRHNDKRLEVWPPAPFSSFIPREFLRYMKQEDHRVYSQILRSVMTENLIKPLETYLQTQVRTTLSQMAADSESKSSGIRPLPYLDRMLFAILTRALLGISPETETFDRFQVLHGSLRIPKLTSWSRRKRVHATIEELTAFLVAQGHEMTRQTNRRAARPICLLSEVVRLEPQRVNDPTMLGNIIYMIEAGRTDVGGLLVWILKCLRDYPECLQALQARPVSSPQAKDLAARVVNEVLRLEQSEYLYRRTLDDIKFGDYVIPKGWVIRVCIREGHRDPRVFENPDTFDPDRFCGREYAHSEYAPFGLFRHLCVGAQLTQAIGRSFVSELAGGFKLNAVEDGPREHPRFHWEPSARFRVRVTRDVERAESAVAAHS